MSSIDQAHGLVKVQMLTPLSCKVIRFGTLKRGTMAADAKRISVRTATTMDWRPVLWMILDTVTRQKRMPRQDQTPIQTAKSTGRVPISE